MLTGLGIPVVLDHMGKFDTRSGAGHADFRNLCAMLRDGVVSVKLTLCRNSKLGPDYSDLRVFHDRLVEANPDNLVWGSDTIR